MNRYCVIYCTLEYWLGGYEAFLCDAEDGDHAQEQCENAYPDCDVVWTFCDPEVEYETVHDFVQAAFDDYYFRGHDHD